MPTGASRTVFRILIATLALGAQACDANGPSALPNRPIVFEARSTAMPWCLSIWSIGTDGTGPAELTTAAVGCTGTPAVSPNGRRIAFAAEGPPIGLHLMNADGTQDLGLGNGEDFDWYPAWSLDGSKLAVISTTRGPDTTSSLWVMNADGSDARYIVSPAHWPTWRPNGRQLAYEGGDCQIWIVNLDGSHAHPLRQGGCDADTLQYQPAWSAATGRIATSSQVPLAGGGWARRILTMDMDGSDPRVLTNGASDVQPAWSPDGTRLTYIQGRYVFSEQLYLSDLVIVASDGTDQRTLLTSDLIQHPTW